MPVEEREGEIVLMLVNCDGLIVGILIVQNSVVNKKSKSYRIMVNRITFLPSDYNLYIRIISSALYTSYILMMHVGKGKKEENEREYQRE